MLGRVFWFALSFGAHVARRPPGKYAGKLASGNRQLWVVSGGEFGPPPAHASKREFGKHIQKHKIYFSAATKNRTGYLA